MAVVSFFVFSFFVFFFFVVVFKGQASFGNIVYDNKTESSLWNPY